MAGLGKVCLFLGKTSKNLLIFIHFPLDISPLDSYKLIISCGWETPLNFQVDKGYIFLDKSRKDKENVDNYIRKAPAYAETLSTV